MKNHLLGFAGVELQIIGLSPVRNVLKFIWYCGWVDRRNYQIWIICILVKNITWGVPQGSVLGPLLFLLYSADIGSIASKHHINSHSFADDTQLHLSGNPKDAQFLRFSIVACINQISEWCIANKLKLNTNKPEFWSATSRRQSQLHTTPIDLSDGNIRPSKVVCDLGVIIDSQLSFAQHVNSITCKCYSELRQIKSFRHSLPTDAARIPVNSLSII